jgi:phage host-nuclease inhibitor protein Gam
MGPDFWVKVWEREVRSRLTAGRRVVVDDCRFENEDRLIRELGGIHVRIARAESNMGAGITHVSESYRPKADYLVLNLVGLSRFKAAVNGLMQTLGKTHEEINAITIQQ